MKLAQLQQSFQAHVLGDDPAIIAEIAGDERFSTAMRLNVYTDAYTVRLGEVLAATFPAVRAALGADAFEQLVTEFSRTHPSSFRSVRDYGGELPRWSAGRLTGPRAQGIADLARFEWTVADAFDAADQPPLMAASLAGTAPERWPHLRFAFSPTLRRLSVSSNCVAWWKFACAAQARPTRWRPACTQQWLVWRQDLAVFYRRLSRTETQALDAAIAGASFGEWCEQVTTASVAALLLQRWFNTGLIIATRAA